MEKGEVYSLAIKRLTCDHDFQTVTAYGLYVDECVKCGDLKDPRPKEEEKHAATK